MTMSKGTINAIVFYSSVIAGLVLIAILNGCGKRPPEAPATVITTPTGTVYEIPVRQVKDKEITPAPGKQDEDVVAVIVVLACANLNALQFLQREQPAVVTVLTHTAPLHRHSSRPR